MRTASRKKALVPIGRFVKMVAVVEGGTPAIAGINNASSALKANMAAKVCHEERTYLVKIPIPTEPSFIVPEGQYRAILINVIPLQERKQVRLVFRIYHPEGQPLNAGKNYNLEEGFSRNGDLRQDLRSWRGRDFTKEEAESGTFDLNTMLGQQADLVIGHRHNDRFDKPYVFIAEILPAGTIVPNAPVVLQPAF